MTSCVNPTTIGYNTWQSRFRIWFPWVQHVHLVFTEAYFAQVFNTIIALIAIHMVNLLLWPAIFTDCPDGMMQINTKPSLVYITIYA